MQVVSESAVASRRCSSGFWCVQAFQRTHCACLCPRPESWLSWLVASPWHWAQSGLLPPAPQSSTAVHGRAQSSAGTGRSADCFTDTLKGCGEWGIEVSPALPSRMRQAAQKYRGFQMALHAISRTIDGRLASNSACASRRSGCSGDMLSSSSEHARGPLPRKASPQQRHQVIGDRTPWTAS